MRHYINSIRLFSFLLSLLVPLVISLLSESAMAASHPSRVAFVGTYGGIYIVDVGNPGSTKLIADTSGFNHFPKWSPNGSTLAYVDYEGVGTQVLSKIVLTNRDGNKIGTPLVVPGGRQIGGLDWSPDGHQIAYLCSLGTLHEIPPDPMIPNAITTYSPNVCILDVATGATRVLSASTDSLYLLWGPEVAQSLSWSPKGNTIIVTGFHAGPCDPYYGCTYPGIAAIDVATGVMSLLVNYNIIYAEFSPDGSEILYNLDTSAVLGGTTGINILNLSSGVSRQVRPLATGDYATEVRPTWSPDGKEILFSACPRFRYNGCELYRMSVHGGPEIAVTKPLDPQGEEYATWAGPVTLCTVPALRGKIFSKAKALIQKAGCALGKVSGPTKNRNNQIVTKQNPVAKKNVPSGTAVAITVK